MFRQTPNTNTKKKSKSHGNRRLQRFKRKHRTRGLDEDAIRNLLLDHPPHMASNVNGIGANQDAGTGQPMADVSAQNKQESTDDGSSKLGSESGHRWMTPPNAFEQAETQHSNLSTDIWKQRGSRVPQYQKMGRSLFQESLANAIPQYQQDIRLWLANPKVFNFVKQLVHNATVVYHSEMELHYWNAMITAAGSTLALLSSESRDFTRKNYVHWDYPQTERNIRHRQQGIQNRMNQFKAKLSAHMEHQTGIGMTAESMEIIRQASNAMIEVHFRMLYVKLNDKLILLQYDLYDVHLVKSFYDMFPNEAQIAAVRRVWRLKDKSNKRAIVRSKKASQGMTQNNDSNQDMDHHFDAMLSNASIAPPMRAVVEARLANMEQRKQQIINLVTKHSFAS